TKPDGVPLPLRAALDEHFARAGLQQAIHQPEGSGFPGAAAAQQDQHLAALDAEIEGFHQGVAPIDAVGNAAQFDSRAAEAAGGAQPTRSRSGENDKLTSGRKTTRYKGLSSALPLVDGHPIACCRIESWRD